MRVAVNDGGDFDQLALAGVTEADFGANTWGDFDQLSLAGVDFGEDYCKDHGIEPNNLEGEDAMNGYDNQLGSDFDQMGIVPEGLGGQYNQMGLVPSGLSGQYNQMGILPAGLSGFVPTNLDFKTWTPTQYAGVAGLLLGAVVVARKMGFIKMKLPLIG